MVEALEVRQLLATITVDSAGDADGADGGTTLSLRQAIEIANGTLAVASLTATQQGQVAGALSTPNAIDFGIPGTGPFSIVPTSSLPTITTPVVIDGYSQPGSRPNTNEPNQVDNAVIEVALIGGPNGPNNGLDIDAGESTVEGLAIGGFGAYGIELLVSGSNLIEGDFIGTDVTGTKALPNQASGIDAEGGGSNTIGGTTAGARNVISGNGNGDGLYISASSSANLVEGDFVGTDVTGTKALPNNIGIEVYNNSSATIGGTAAGVGNVISGNTTDGLFIAYSSHNLVEGNFIGTDITGAKALPNNTGILVSTFGPNTIGGTVAGAGNIISGNTADGLFLEIGRTLLEGNFVGTDVTGIKAIPNQASGIDVQDGGSDTIGGTAAGAGNVISGNTAAGLELAGASSDLVEGNFVGTDVTGTIAIPNDSHGITIAHDSGSNTIGGTAAGARNIISGNTADGLSLSDSSSDNVVEGNFVGTDVTGTLALPNAGSGILIEASPYNTIGATVAGAGNVIAFNRNSGVGIEAVYAPSFNSVDERISGNSIYANGGLGIDLGLDGVTPNNPSGSPNGPNLLQPYPVLTSAAPTPGGPVISGTLDAAASTAYTVEFFANLVADPSGFGQDQTYLGSDVVTTDAAGHDAFSFDAPSAAAGRFLSVTATDPRGNTSEFARDLFAMSSTTTQLAVPPGPVFIGLPLTLVATVGAVPDTGTPTGEVAFTEDGLFIGYAALDASGSGSLTIPAPDGTHSFEAS